MLLGNCLKLLEIIDEKVLKECHPRYYLNRLKITIINKKTYLS